MSQISDQERIDALLRAAKAFRDAMVLSPRHTAEREEALLAALILTDVAIEKAEGK